MSLSRQHAEEGTGNILRTMQFTSKQTDICLDNCHVTLIIYLLCPCLYRMLVRSYMQVRHTYSRENVINYKGLRPISIYRENPLYFNLTPLIPTICSFVHVLSICPFFVPSSSASIHFCQQFFFAPQAIAQLFRTNGQMDKWTICPHSIRPFVRSSICPFCTCSFVRLFICRDTTKMGHTFKGHPLVSQA